MARGAATAMSPSLPHIDGVSHEEITVRGLRRHVATAGPADGRSVFLHHGWPQHFWMWRHLMPALAAEGFRVVAPDSRGFGWTEHPPDEDFSHQAFVDDAVALCDALGLESIRFVGHDWGCWFGFMLCLERPDLVERAVLASAPHPWPPEPAADLETLKRLSSLAYQVAIGAPGVPRDAKLALFGTVARVAHGERFSDEELEAYMAPLRLATQVRASTLLYRNTVLHELAPVAQGKYRERRLEVPTLYLMGDGDPLYDEPQFHALREHGDHVRTEVIAGAGHFLPEEAPDALRDRVLAHLS